MKKLLTALSVIVAVFAHAANINWTISGKGTATDYAGANFSGTVYFILASDVSSLTGNTAEAEFLSALDNLVLEDTHTTSDGSKPSVSDVVVSDSKITGTASQTFGILIYSQDTDGNGYYKLTTASQTGYADGAGADAQTKVSTSWTTLRNADWVSAWTKPTDPDPGPTPDVPEPATGALALAGVALLFKRRRA